MADLCVVRKGGQIQGTVAGSVHGRYPEDTAIRIDNRLKLHSLCHTQDQLVTEKIKKALSEYLFNVTIENSKRGVTILSGVTILVDFFKSSVLCIQFAGMQYKVPQIEHQ